MKPTVYSFTTKATPPEGFDAALEKLLAAEMSALIGAQMHAALTIGMLTSPRPTCLRMRADGSLEVVELDDAGKIVEPVRCTCHRFCFVLNTCPIHSGIT